MNVIWMEVESFIRGTLVRSILVGLLAVLVMLLVSRIDHEQDDHKVDQQAWQYWSTYFNHFYKTQDVSVNKEQLQAHVAQYSEHLHLVLWDASHQVLFTNQPIGFYDEHGQVLSVDGQVVGAFMVNMKEPFTLTPFQWIPIWLGGGLIALMYAWQVSRIRGRHQP